MEGGLRVLGSDSRFPRGSIWEFPKMRGTLFGVPIVRILLFRVLYWGPLFSETPIWVVVKIMIPFWVLIVMRHLIFRVPQKGAIILTTTHMYDHSGIILVPKDHLMVSGT